MIFGHTPKTWRNKVIIWWNDLSKWQIGAIAYLLSNTTIGDIMAKAPKFGAVVLKKNTQRDVYWSKAQTLQL